VDRRILPLYIDELERLIEFVKNCVEINFQDIIHIYLQFVYKKSGYMLKMYITLDVQ